MFESAILGHKIDKETFKAEEPKLRAALLAAAGHYLRLEADPGPQVLENKLLERLS